MAREAKTKPTDASVNDFINAVESPQRREDARTVLAMMERVAGEPAVMWGPSIIGFGSYPVMCGKREERWPRSGFSPRKAATVVYVVPDYPEKQNQLARLGKHTASVSCVNIKKLSDVDLNVLEEMVRSSLQYMDAKYPR
jgi:hypothetical protein